MAEGILCLILRYAERTNKGEVVVKHGVEDGWGAGCKATVQFPPGIIPYCDLGSSHNQFEVLSIIVLRQK